MTIRDGRLSDFTAGHITSEEGRILMAALQQKLGRAEVEFFPGVRKTHTMGFFRVEEDVPSMRRAGSLFWGGGANTHYWVDPKSDLAGVFLTQLFPYCDARVMRAFEAFERATYETFGPDA